MGQFHWTPPATDEPVEQKSTGWIPPATDVPVTPEKKSSVGSLNTQPPLNLGGFPDLNSPARTNPITPFSPAYHEEQAAKDEQLRQQKAQQADVLSKQLQKVQNALDPSLRADFDVAKQAVASRAPDRLSAPTAEELAHTKFMDDHPVLGALRYLGSKATKGTVQIAKGISHIANMANNPGLAAAGIDPNEATFDKVDDLANLGLTKTDFANVESGKGIGNHALSAAGMAAEFAPSVLGGEALQSPRALLFLQGVGQGTETVKQIEASGTKLNPLAKEALIQGSGAVNLLLSDLGESVFGKLPSGLKQNIATSLAADAIKESAGKAITIDAFKKSLQDKAADFLKNFSLKTLDHFKNNVQTFTKLNGANFAMHKGVDALSDKPVFNENLGNLAENEYKAVTQDAPIFTIPGMVRDATKLGQYSGYKNEVVDALIKDPNKVGEVKELLNNHASEQGWTQEETDATLAHVDKIAQAAKAIPATANPDKRADAVALVVDRNDLQTKLKQLQAERGAQDPSIAEIVSPQEQYLTDKIEQANDKLRSMVTGERTTYSKVEGEEGKETKYFKTTDGKKESIDKSRYELENLERTTKQQNNEITKTNGEVNQEENGVAGQQMEQQPELNGDSEESIGQRGQQEKPERLLNENGAENAPLLKGEENAIQEQTAREMGVRNAPEVQQGVGGQNESVKPTEESKPIEAKGEDETQTTLRNADVEAKRKEYGFDEPAPRKGATNAELTKKADAAISKGVDAHEIMDRALDKKQISDVESVVLAKFQGAKEAELLDINDQMERDQASSPTKFAQLVQDRDRVLNDLQRSYNASEAAGTVASNALRARQVKVLRDYSLANLLIRKREANGGQPLTQEQITQTTKTYKDLKDKSDALEAKVAELTKKEAQKGLDYVARSAGRRSKTAEIDSQISDVFANIKKIAKEQRSTLSANPIPIEYIPEIAKLVKLYAQKGLIKLADVVDALHEGLKDEIPGLTREQLEQTIADIPRLEAAKSRMKTNIRNITSRIDSKDFSKVLRKPIVLDKEGLELRDALEKARYQYEVELYRDQFARRTRAEKTRDALTEVMNVPRALMASTDFSAPLRQGLVMTTSHPILAGKAAVHMFKSAFSPKEFDRWFYDLKEAPDYHTIKESKLFIADPHKPELSAKEEQFMTNLADKIPVIGKLVAGSERAYVAYLNKLRVDLFRQFSEVLQNDGKSPAANPEIYKGLARFIDNATGRGDFTNENLAQALNIGFFSPRLIASRLNLLNPVWYAKLPKEVRYKALADVAKFVAVGTSVLALAKLNGMSVETDPRSSDFGKIRKDDRRWDIWGGFSQYARVIAQVASGQTKSANTGEIADLGGDKMGARTRLDVLGTFFRNKLSPIPAFALNSLSGKDAMGQPFDPVSAIPKNLIPLTLQDTYQAIQQDGLKGAFTTGVPTTFGVGVQPYNDVSPKLPQSERQISDKLKGDATAISAYKGAVKENKSEWTNDFEDDWMDDKKVAERTKLTKYWKGVGRSPEYIKKTLVTMKQNALQAYISKQAFSEAKDVMEEK